MCSSVKSHLQVSEFAFMFELRGDLNIAHKHPMFANMTSRSQTAFAKRSRTRNGRKSIADITNRSRTFHDTNLSRTVHEPFANRSRTEFTNRSRTVHEQSSRTEFTNRVHGVSRSSVTNTWHAPCQESMVGKRGTAKGDPTTKSL